MFHRELVGGGRARATELGFKVEELLVGSAGMTIPRLDSILQATLPPTLVNDTPVGPTLLVGLGGTLIRVRRLNRGVCGRGGGLRRLLALP